MKTIWSGTLQLGAVAIPVGLAPTVRDNDPTFRVLHQACKNRIRLRSWCDLDEELLDAEDVVTAWEVVPGEYLVLDPDERAALEPQPSRRIPINAFLAARDLDPQLARKRYWLVPSKTTVGRRAYVTLAEAMHQLDAVALVRFTAWQSEQVAAITSRGRQLELATLHYAEDLVQAEPVDAEPVEADVELARELVQRHTRRLKPSDLASLERPRVQALLERKLAGEPIIRPEADREAAPEPEIAHMDLTHALRQSLRTAPRRRRARATAAR